jgi:polyferredoxin
VVVFAALFAAFLTLRPVLASYEPFAALFSLHGTTLQWFLLFVVLVASLAVYTPWCNFFCPMRTFEVAIQDVKRWRKGRGPEDVTESA